MPLDFGQRNLLTGGSNEFSTSLQSFDKLTHGRMAELAQRAPEACGGGELTDPAVMEACANAVCADKKTTLKPFSDHTGFSRPDFYSALRGTAFLSITDPVTVKALRYHLASTMADIFCKNPPNDGHGAVVTDRVPAPAPQTAPLFVALVGLAALAAVRLGSLVRPEFRSASPALIQGIYLWMGITPPTEFIAPVLIDGQDSVYRYNGA